MTTSEQPTLDFTESKRQRDIGIQRSHDGAPEKWRDHARAIVELLALSQPEVVSDDVWARGLPPSPKSNTALGGVFTWAARQGFIAKTDRVRQTTQVKQHACPMTVWKSLIHREAS